MVGGGTRIFRMVKGGPVFFSVGQRGDQNFLRVKEGGTRIFLRMQRGDEKQLATGDHKQTTPPCQKMIAT